MRKILLALAGTALATGVATPSTAATYLVTLNGTANGFDQTGEFGGTGDFNSLPAVVQFYINDLMPGARNTLSPTTRTLSGGFYWDPFLGSPVKAKVTINGITYTIGYSSDPDAKVNSDARLVDNYFGTDEFSYSSTEFGENDQRFFVNYVSVSNLSTNLSMINGLQFNQPASYTFGSQDTVGTGFQFYEFNKQVPGTARFASGQFNFASMSVEALAVPEPSTWAMIIMGIGLVGAGLRRQRQLLQPAPAAG